MTDSYEPVPEGEPQETDGVPEVEPGLPEIPADGDDAAEVSDDELAQVEQETPLDPDVEGQQPDTDAGDGS